MSEGIEMDRRAGLFPRDPMRQAAAMATLLETSAAVAASSLDLDALLAQILTAIDRLVPADRASVSLNVPGRDVLQIAIVRGSPEYVAQLTGQERPTRGSITGRVYRTGEAALIDDLLAPEWRGDIYLPDDHPDRHQIVRSGLFVPLVADQPVGVIFLGRMGTHAFTLEDLHILTLFGPQVAIAVTNARQYAATRAQADGLQALLTASERFANYTPTGHDDPLTDFARIVAQEAVRIVPHTRTALARREPAGSAIRTLVYLRDGKFYPPTGVFADGEGLTGWVMARGEPLRVNEAQHDPRSRYFHGEDRATLREHVVVVPLIVERRATGALTIIRRDAPPFTDEEFARLQLYARQAATSMERVLFTVQLQERNAALLRANMHKDAFLTNMSHELRTPLNAVIGFAQLLVDGAVTDAVDRQGAYEDILASGKHLLMMVNDILDVARIESGQQTVSIVPTDLAEEIGTVERMIAPLVAEKGQTLAVTIPNELPRVLADRDRLRQVLLNLLSNAHKFTPPGGALTLDAARPTPDCVTIRVRDTGIGIAPEDQRVIFEAFRQVESGYARAQQGTGLGLTLSKQLVERMGGTISVASALGAGSVFMVTLRVSNEKQGGYNAD